MDDSFKRKGEKFMAFASRDGSEMARKLREMMGEAPDESTRQEMQRLIERVENM